MPEILAAGVVATRPGREVLLVHRPKYDDWSFPKGKLDPGEHPVVAAVRETREETGLRVRLGVPLTTQRYPLADGRTKQVRYWAGRVRGDDDVAGYRAGDEIDEVRWVPTDAAASLLSYDRDRSTLTEALGVRRRTRAHVVLRHGHALDRAKWRGPDPERPLTAAGEQEAADLAGLLEAYGVRHLVSSRSRRCVQTVQPYAHAAGRDLDLRRELSEEHASARGVAKVVGEVVEGRASVLCSHRPVLPWVYDAFGIDLAPEAPGLAPAEMLVLHLHRGDVVAVERHAPGRRT
ncbi:NUDIX hydrolase [Nocardioides sp. zg-ZUI104]|uniref:NUDIX hydrolase n=1 Tax=Nocardioides faecalis TaxID=2803858 RepID=UPI001BD13D3F|nr:NUDIX domain-containing protein [Nocardioides faecalis]MBS4753270.1 NUDIX hydrolase [Nocardioides faecalis]